MIGGFGAIAWPVRYGETGIMTFIMGHDGIVYQQDLGPRRRKGRRHRRLRSRQGLGKGRFDATLNGHQSET